MSHSTVRLGNGELDAVTELHRVNLSPENRFEASPLRGNSTATGPFRRHLGVLVRNGRDHSMALCNPAASSATDRASFPASHAPPCSKCDPLRPSFFQHHDLPKPRPP